MSDPSHEEPDAERAVERVGRLAGLLAESSEERAPVDVFAVVRAAEQRQTSRGDPFWTLSLGDASATVAAKIWSKHHEAMTAALSLRPGQAVKVRGWRTTYRGAVEIEIAMLRVVEPGDPDYDADVLYGAGASLIAGRTCRTMVFDIETVPGVARRDLPSTVAEALGQFADRRDSEPEKVMGMSPMFGKVVSLAFGDGEDEGAPVHVLVVPRDEDRNAEMPDWVTATDEAGLLRAFWALAAAAETVVSFNGRNFDVPFLVGRSLVLGVDATVDLMSNRWSLRPHLDLFDAVGQAGRGPSKLDVICWALGIESPKGAMDGSMVAGAYERGELLEIAKYNRLDVAATSAVYRRVRDRVLRYRSDW